MEEIKEESKTFFIDWQLWQQMSFGLAVMLSSVVIWGIIRLKYLNWKADRYQLQDEEKQAKMDSVGKTGLKVKRDSDIPFGIRAIEHGIEVEGIWVSSRPSTPVPTTPKSPTEKPFASVTTLGVAAEDGPSSGKGNGKAATEGNRERSPENGAALVQTGSAASETRSATASPILSPKDFYRPKQPSQLRSTENVPQTRMVEVYAPSRPRPRPSPPSTTVPTWPSTSSSEHDGRNHTPNAVPNSPYQQHPASYTRQVRDYPPSITSSRGQAQNIMDAPLARSESGIGHAMAQYESPSSMPPPEPTFVPGQQTRGYRQ